MGGSGHISQMQAMLKNNRRRKKRLFDTLEPYVNLTSKSEPSVSSKKATPGLLKDIRIKLERENERAHQQKIVFVISASLVGILLYLIFNFVKL